MDACLVWLRKLHLGKVKGILEKILRNDQELPAPPRQLPPKSVQDLAPIYQLPPKIVQELPVPICQLPPKSIQDLVPVHQLPPKIVQELPVPIHQLPPKIVQELSAPICQLPLEPVQDLSVNDLAPICRLPPEIVQDLARNLLEPFEAALLALCNKKLYHLIGTMYLQTCREDSKQGNKLLSVLERDFPEVVHCVRCVKFHPATSVPYINLIWNCHSVEREIRWSCVDREYLSTPRDELRFIYIQALLKRQRLGLETKYYIQALSHEYLGEDKYGGRHCGGSCYEPYYSLSEVRIVCGELLGRQQEWRFYPAEILRKGFPYNNVQGVYHGCYHHLNGSIENQLQKLVFEPLDCESVNGSLRQCRYCYSELQLNIIPVLDLALERPEKPRLYDRYVAVIKTTWSNYGNGNEKYMSRFRFEKPRDREQFVHNPVVFEPGSIRDAFEHGKEFYFENVLSEEKKRAMKALFIEFEEKLARTENNFDPYKYHV